jgi:hypothetical protein
LSHSANPKCFISDAGFQLFFKSWGVPYSADSSLKLILSWWVKADNIYLNMRWYFEKVP